MHKPRSLVLLAASALVLAGCSSTTEPGAGDDAAIAVVATTNIYGSLVEQIGGDRVDVTSIITSASQDPHSYEASARDRLTVQGADLVIENGGGYDSFMDALLEGPDAHVLSAVEFSHDFPGNEGHGEEHEGEDAGEHDHAEDDEHDHDDHEGHDHIDGFNEHVWFDPHTMIHVVAGIAEELGEIDPDGASEFTASADEIISELEGFEGDLEELAASADGTGVFITEPLPGYIAAAAGLTDLAPDGFASAVEEGSDVAPATLLRALDAIESGEVVVVLTNAQTGGAETERIEQAAEAAGIPIVAFTELLEG
ncbi:zinc ABC transporter substrate-binding protein, partial [uncultured Microbacterium sp.]|uniref:metal ABC transporter solute-binding protein, Zn/Mn family n=1 Tax=uncultured Microbacterium sp. TaxID=191216 RepID=UPI002604422A